jgi:hypothetical protein
MHTNDRRSGWLVSGLAVLLIASLPVRSVSAQRAKPSRTQIVLLGTGTPGAAPDRSGPATAVVVDGVPYLVDFGPGVVRRAAAAVEKGIAGLRPSNFGVVFATGGVWLSLRYAGSLHRHLGRREPE